MKYEQAEEIEARIKAIAEKLGIRHDFSRVICVRSSGSKSKRTLARCHALSRIMQTALNTKAHYVVEVIAENFDKLGEAEKTKTLIHELLHIPKSFGGGFRHHNYASRKNVERMYKMLCESRVKEYIVAKNRIN